MSALVLVLTDRVNYNNFYSHSKVQTIINESDIDGVFKSIYTPIISDIPLFSGKNSGWIIDLVIDHDLNISNYNPLKNPL